MNTTVRLLVACALALLAPQTASALIVDFTSAGPAGNYGSHTYTSGPVTVEAFYFATGGYTNSNSASSGQPITLFVRNNANDHGFGVCNPNEQTNAACNPPATYGGGGGDINELDNLGTNELIRLTLADGWDWTSVWVSSLDSSEAGELWYGNSASLTSALARPLDFATLFLAFQSNGSSTVEFQYGVTGAAAAAKYLYVIPGGALATAGDNDYLVWKVQVDSVPEPSTLALLAVGLAGLGRARRRG